MKNLLFAILAFMTLSFSANAQFGDEFPRLYWPGNDTIIATQTCDVVTRNFTNCDGKPDTYRTYLPGKDLVMLKTQGQQLTPSQLREICQQFCGQEAPVAHEAIPDMEPAGWWFRFWNSDFMDFIKWVIALLVIGAILLGLFRLLRELWPGNTTSDTNIVSDTTTRTVPSGMIMIPEGGYYFPPSNGAPRKFRVVETGIPPAELASAVANNGGQYGHHVEDSEAQHGYQINVNPPAPPVEPKKE